jgi:hypothetical protein
MRTIVGHLSTAALLLACLGGAADAAGATGSLREALRRDDAAAVMAGLAGYFALLQDTAPYASPRSQ